MNTGKVSQVIGAVVDVEFEGKMPEILNAITVDQKGDEAKGIPDIKVTLEVASHLGENKVRTVAMSATDGLVRGMPAVDTGQPITVPVGKASLGRIMNVIGEGVDNLGPISAEKRLPIHRPAPDFAAQEPVTQMFETGNIQQARTEERRDSGLQGAPRISGVRRGGQDGRHGKCDKSGQRHDRQSLAAVQQG